MKTAQNFAGTLGVLLGDAPALPWAYPTVVLVVTGVVVVVLDRREKAG